MNKTKQSKKDTKKKRQLNRRLLNYSLAAGTTLALATPVNAAIRYSGVKNQAIDNSLFQLDMQDVINGTPDGNPEFSFYNNNTNFTYTSTITTGGGKRFAVTYDYTRRYNGFYPINAGDAFMANAAALNPGVSLPKGAAVGPSATNFVSNTYGLLNKYYKVNFQGVNILDPAETFNTSYKFSNGNFGGKRGYMGVRFNISGNTHYGWIQFDAPGASGTIVNWAYEDKTGKAIAPGASGTIVDWAYEDKAGKAIAAGDTGLVAPVVSVPTLNQWGMIFLTGLILLEGARRLRKKKGLEEVPK